MKRFILWLILCAPAAAQWSAPPASGYSAINTFLSSLMAAQTGAGVPMSACTAGKDFYLNTSTTPAAPYFCDASGWHAFPLQALAPANNLSDLASAATARTNLGLGTAALQANPLTTAGDVLVGGASGAFAKLANPGAGTFCFNWASGSSQPTLITCPGAGGGLSSVGLTAPAWLAVSNSPLTANGTIALTPAAAQTSHQVLGTCGGATTFGPCVLGLTDLPNTIINSGGSYTDPAWLSMTWSGGRITGIPTFYYQTVQSNTSAQTQRASLNFSANFSLADSAGSNRTTIDLAPTITANSSGTAANLSGTPALPNGTTATTQIAGDSSADLATDSFVAAAISTKAAATASCVVTSSATPTFDVNTCNGTSGKYNAWKMVVTANVTSFAFSNATDGGNYFVELAHDGTTNIYTIATASNLAGFPFFPSNIANGTVSAPCVYYVSNGTCQVPGTSNLFSAIPTAADSTVGNADAGTVRCYGSSTRNGSACKDASGNVLGGVKDAAAVSNQFMTGIVNGVISQAQPSAANLSDGNTGTGAVAHATSPTFVTPALGTPASGDASNLTNIPVSSAKSGSFLPHANIASTAVTPGSYTNANITVAADGSVTAAANGASGGASPGASVFNITTSTAANTGVTATSTFGGAQSIGAGYLIASTPLTVTNGGIYSVPSSYAGTVTFAVFLDGAQIAATGALSVTPTAVTNGTWAVNCQLTTYTTGSSGSYVFGCPLTLLPSSNSTIAASGSLAMTAAGSINTTTSHTIDFKWTWSSATGAPSVTAQWGTGMVGGAPVASVSIDGGSAQTGAVALTSKVTSVFTRSGAVTATSGDYSAAQVTNAVDKTASNTYSGGGTQDFTADTIKYGPCGAHSVQNDELDNSSLTTEQTFSYSCTQLGAATANTVDGIHHAMLLHLGWDVVGTGGPTFMFKIKACTSGNWTGSACTGGGTALYTYPSTASTNAVGDGASFLLNAQSTAGTFSVNRLGRSLFGGSPTNVSTEACGATCTGGSWVMYFTLTFGTAASGSAVCGSVTTGGNNCMAMTSEVVEYKQ